jgi:hypothetical protein
MTVRTTLACLLLGACASSKPITAEYHDNGDVIVWSDKRVAIVNEQHLDPKRTAILRKKWFEPSYDDGERKAFRLLLWGNVADAISTGAMRNAGCAETNAAMRNPVAVLLFKGLWLAWWRDAAAQSPDGFSHAGDAKYAGVFFGAGALNLRAATNGCRLW